MAVWPFILVAALLAAAIGARRRSAKLVWVASLVSFGVVAMRAGSSIDVPTWWLYAGLLWSGIAVASTFVKSVKHEAFCLLIVPTGYFILFTHHSHYEPGNGGFIENLGYGLTEVPALVAILMAGVGGFYERIRRWLVETIALGAKQFRYCCIVICIS